MGKHKKHHKKRSSHGHSTPAFPYPTPAFYTPSAPKLPLHSGLPPPSTSPPSSLCVSIHLNSLQQQQQDWSDTQQQQKHKSHHHHHHHHRKSHHKHKTDSGNTSSNIVFESADLAGGGVERPAIPPLRISLHPSTSSSSLSSSSSSPSALSSSSSSLRLAGGGGGEGEFKELKVSLPISRLQGGREEGGDGGRKEKHHKKHKKHKEKRRHEHEPSGGVKTLPHVEFGTKLGSVSGGVDERPSQGDGGGGGEGERKSYGGKGLGHRDPVESLGGSRGNLQSHRLDRAQKEHPLSLSYTSHHPPPSHPPSSHPPTSHQTPSSHPPPSPSDHSPIEIRFSDKYYQHKKRMMEKEEPDSVVPHSSHPHSSHPHSTHPPSVQPTLPHPLPSSQSTPPEPHKHHKKKKKKKHSKSHSTDPPSHRAPVEVTKSEEKLVTPSISDVPIPSLEREIVDLRPLSPPTVSSVQMEKKKKKEEKGKEEGWLAAKKIKISTVSDASPSMTFAPPPVSAPETTPTSISGESWRGMTSEATLPKRRRTSSQAAGKPSSAGKQLWMMETGGGGESEEEEEGKFGGVLADYDPPPMAHLPAPSPQPSHQPQVLLSRASLKMFLANILRLVQKHDPEGIFAEPVTDEIAPGYSALIKHPMDLSIMATKLSNHAYSSVDEFRSDFVLMCKNAMTYNAPETVYFSFAKSVMENGIKVIEREVSLRPDIRYGRVATPSNSQTPVPMMSLSSRGPSPAPSLTTLDYSSQYICRINLNLLPSFAPVVQPQVVGMATSPAPSSLEEVGVATEQSHLTQVVVGVPPEEREEGEVGEVGGGGGVVPVSLVNEEDPAEILRQVQRAAEEAKENLDANRPDTNYCFIQDTAAPSPSPQSTDTVTAGRKKATMNILNPDSGLVDSSRPLNLTALSERVRGGNNAATVLRTELPMFKATPVSYLMNGPFGSFAPTYDSAFATLTKMDSDLLLHTYGSDLGVSYSHSLLQFVKGAGGFASEMADAVLNSLTAGRHEKFMEKYHAWEEKERVGRLKKEEGNKKEEKEGGEEEKEEEGKSEEKEEAEGGEQENITDTETVGGDREESHEGGGEGEEGEVSGIEGESQEEATEAVGEDQETVEGGEERDDWFVGEVEKEEEGGEGGEGEKQAVDDSSEHSSTDRESSEDRDSSEEREDEEEESGSEMSASLSPPPDGEEEQGEQSGTQPTGGNCSPVREGLTEGAQLISDLQSYQWERLSQPPSLDESGHTLIPPPSQEERNTATKLVGQLAVLTAQTRPEDLVQVPSLREAMGRPTGDTPSPSSPHLTSHSQYD